MKKKKKKRTSAYMSIKTPVMDFEEVRVDVKFQVRSLT